jgi:hypothetical protein
VLQVKLLPSGSAALAGLLAQPGEAPRSLSEHEAVIAGAVRERSARRR